MRRILIVWHDRDGSRTTHEFRTGHEAEPWLRSVLGDIVSSEDLAESGHAVDGIGMLCLYAAEGYDDVGTIDVFVDGVGVSPADLNE